MHVPNAANFAANIHLHQVRGSPSKEGLPVGYTAQAGLMATQTYTFDAYCQYDDGRLVLFQRKGQDKSSATDKTLGFDQLEKDFLDKLSDVEQHAEANGDGNYAAILRRAKQEKKLYAELCTSRRLSDETRQDLITRAAECDYHLWIVSPNLADKRAADRMVCGTGLLYFSTAHEFAPVGRCPFLGRSTASWRRGRLRLERHRPGRSPRGHTNQ